MGRPKKLTRDQENEISNTIYNLKEDPKQGVSLEELKSHINTQYHHNDEKYFVYNGTKTVIGETFNLFPDAIYSVDSLPKEYLNRMLTNKISRRTPEFQFFSGVVADRNMEPFIVNKKTRVRKSSLLATEKNTKNGEKVSPDGYVLHETPYIGVPHYITYEAELVPYDAYIAYKARKEMAQLSSLEEMNIKYAVE